MHNLIHALHALQQVHLCLCFSSLDTDSPRASLPACIICALHALQQVHL